MKTSRFAAVALAAGLVLPVAALAEMKSETKAETTVKTAAAPVQDFGKNQTSTDMRTTKLVGLAVYNTANENIGDINDLIVDTTGKITYGVVGVGGFLGIGEKNVAVPYDAFQLGKDENGNAIARLDATKDQLTSAPTFTYAEQKS